jgi:prepilin-type N-terminal cleavage/methylation domain-containing protein
MTHCTSTVRRRHGRRRGFTLAELLIVIGILAFLLTMLIPVVGRIRTAGYKTNTASQINALRAGCEAYYQTFQAYPGPLPDSACVAVAANSPTMSENLVLGLLGGLASPSGTFTPSLVGQGPVGMGTPSKQYKPFYEGAGQLSVELGKLVITPGLGRFTDDRNQQALDSNIPEFVDRFSEPLPILYMRARRGAGGVATDKNETGAPIQYDIRQVKGYTNVNLSGKVHGLKAVSADNTELTAPTSTGPPPNADLYLLSPSEHNAKKTRMTGSPRAKDSYILIGAGADRTFGTSDDITSFGSVLP